MLASELVAQLIRNIELNGDADVMISVANFTELIGARDKIKLLHHGSTLEIRGNQ